MKRLYWFIAAIAVSCACAVAVCSAYLSVQWHGVLQDHRIEGGFHWRFDPALGLVPEREVATVLNFNRGTAQYRLFTDARGHRINAAGSPLPDSVDVLTAGCSFSFGTGVDGEFTFSETLGRALGLRVANTAVMGSGTVQALLRAEESADLRPRILLYGFISDHIRRNLAPCLHPVGPFCGPQPFVGFGADGDAHLHPPVGDFSVARYRQFYDDVALRGFNFSYLTWGAKGLWKWVKQHRLDWPQDDPRKRRQSMAYLMDRMAASAERMGARLYVVHMPAMVAGQTDAPPAELVAALPEKATLIDVAPAVRRHYAGPDPTPLHFRHDHHPNQRGHALIAAVVGRALAGAVR